MKAATAYTMAKAESDHLGDLIDHQSRIVSLLLMEAQLRGRSFMGIVKKAGEINRSANPENEKGQLKLFEHLQKSEDEMSKFTEDASLYYENGKAFLTGTCDATDAFSTICEAVFGWTFDGKKVANRHLIVCDDDEYEDWGKWIKNRKKVKEHAERLQLEGGRLWAHMGGWNSKPVVMYREGEWRKFDSVAAAVKGTGLNRKKIEKAIDDGTEYKGWKWMPFNKFEEEKEKIINI